MRTAAIVLGSLLAVVLLAAVMMPMFWAPANGAWPGWHHGGWMWGGGWPWMMVFMGLFWVLLIALLALLGFWLVSQSQGRGPGRSPGNDALRIAQERYARGEISREEYEQLRRDLEQ